MTTGKQLSEFENAALAHNLTGADGSVSAPKCCGAPMLDNGGCSDGCCDDFQCATCGRKIRIAWPD